MTKATGDLLSIGEVARRTGVAVSTVRYYESLGLVPAQRTAANARVFPRHSLRRVSLIQIAGRFGISLTEVAEVFATLPVDRPPSREDWQRISEQWRVHLESRQRALAQLQEELIGCIGCGCLSLKTCGLLNPGDELAAGGSGPRRMAPSEQ